MRGEADFNASRLLGELGELDLSASYKAPPELEAYRAFYGFYSEVDHYIGRLDTGRHYLSTQVLVPTPCRGTVVVCHGYYDHVGLYVYLIEHLLSRGLAVIATDLPGHGLSSGERVTIDHFDTYVSAIHHVLSQPAIVDGAVCPPPTAMVGQSLGGACAMEYVEQHEPGYEHVVLLAPLVRPYAWGVNRFVYGIAKLLIDSRKRTITNNADNPSFIEFQKKDPLQAHVLPVEWVSAMVAWKNRFIAYPERKSFAPKVVQGFADRTVDFKYGMKVLRDRYAPEFLEIPEARHHLVNESEAIRAQMWAWMDEQCGW